jgi:diguanylate cyclase (GGDEF)-like protein
MKLLIAEDEIVSQNLLKIAATKWGYEVVLCSDGTTALEELRHPDAPLLVILDWMMPGLNGPEVIRRLRERKDSPYAYLILLTGKTQAQDIVEGLEAGADDYITKPFNIAELEVRVRAGQRIVQLQAELLATQQALEIQATHDGLTGIWNRRAIMDLLDQELGRCFRTHTPVAIIMADLDHFKQINDTYGHMAGDDVLREASQRIGPNLRNYDAVGRYGGEEFLIVLPGCSPTDALRIAERIRESIAISPVKTSAGNIPITMSLGLAVTGESREMDIESQKRVLVHAADEALYIAKREGRNRVSVAGN